MKKLQLILLLGLLSTSCLACGKTSGDTDSAAASEEEASPADGADSQTGMANPYEEVSQEELASSTGILMSQPEGADEASYYLIHLDSDTTYAQMDFTLDGKEAYLRSATCNLGEIAITEADLADLNGQDQTLCTELGDISGIYDPFDQVEECSVGTCKGVCVVSSASGSGFVAWVDVIHGYLYNLCMTENADPDTLCDLANLSYTPVD